MRIIKHPPISSQEEIYLRLDNGNGCKIKVDSNQTLSELINKIKESKLLLPLEFCLKHAGKQLTGKKKTLRELGIGQNQIVHIQNMIPNTARQIKIDICVYHAGETMIVKAKIKENIAQLKQKLFRVTHISPKSQKLVFRGCKLQDELTLEEYHIKANSLLCLTTEIDHKEVQEIKIETDNQENTHLAEVVNSVRVEERKNLKQLFRSEYFQDRPVYQVEIQQKQDLSHELDSFSRDFNFDLLHPKISELALNKNTFTEEELSCSFNSDSQEQGSSTDMEQRMFGKSRHSHHRSRVMVD